MTILNKLASALNRRDEVPNQELAKKIAAKNDKKSILELVNNLENKDKSIQTDCIKVLYEIGARKPALISSYVKEFTTLLDSKNNRLQWGGMTALSAIVSENPKAIYSVLPKIIRIANEGSVITKDHAVNILIQLCATKQYYTTAFSLLTEQLITCPTNQLPMYAEQAMSIVTDNDKSRFVKILESRLNEVEKETKRKRIEKVIRKLSTIK